MEQMTATRLVGRRLREIRKRRGLTAQAVANLCADAGLPKIKRQVITNIENGFRGYVSIDELLALAYVLNVPPVLLFTPAGTEDELAVTPTESIKPLGALLWVVGEVHWSNTTMLDWRREAMPVVLLRRFYRHEGEVLRESKDASSEAYQAALLELGRTVVTLIDTGIPVPPLQTSLADELDKRGLLNGHRDEIPTYEAGDDSGGR